MNSPPELIDNGHVRAVTMHMTERCNLMCKYCFSKDERNLNRLDEKTALEFCKWYAGQAIEGEYEVTFFGGEPFLEPDLIEYIADNLTRLAPPKVKFVFGATSNGTLIRPEFEGMLKTYKIGVLMSTDGGQYSHDLYRTYPNGKGSFTDFIKGLETVKRTQKRTSARLTFTPETVDLLFENHKTLFLTHGFDTINAAPVTEMHWEKSALNKFENELIDIADFLLSQWDAGKLYHAGIVEKGIKELMGKYTDWNKRFPCGAGRNMAGVGVDGKIYPCHRFVGMNDFEIGDIRKGIIPEKRSIFFEGLNINGNRCKEGGCNNCEFERICNSDCYTVNLVTTNSLKEPGASHYGLKKKRLRVTAIFLKYLIENKQSLLDALLGNEPGTANKAYETYVDVSRNLEDLLTPGRV